MTGQPRVSVVIPSWFSAPTLPATLTSLRAQTLPHEVVVVDSSPDQSAAHVVQGFPEVLFHHSPQRLLPHAARNLGVTLASGEILVFTDPDAESDPDWLARLVAALDRHGHMVYGGVATAGRGWLDLGIHLCKFSKWLPAGPERTVDNGPSINLAMSRVTFDQLGGFDPDALLGDAALAWRGAEQGTLWLIPDATVAHHHIATWGSFLNERLRRGRIFAAMRITERRLGRGRILTFLIASALLLRLPRILVLVARQCQAGGAVGGYVATLPVIALGHTASLLGEARGYVDALVGGKREVGRGTGAGGTGDSPGQERSAALGIKPPTRFEP